ncbi:hypothetical protein GDO81_029081 [Engystomops pustulosus]|uniref:Nicotinamide N-methyltransferase n=2 Tax=Engystomops pustulosus TaxID=76066 RepID=A0AAV6ZCB1_ENGPU|nr:hypothetical protein GDO81_029081 [Engystomops pustulosus]
MDPVSNKSYHEHEVDPKVFLDVYCSPGIDQAIYDEITIFPMKTLQKLMSSGKITGTTLIDFSTGPMIGPMLSICDYFTEIIILEANDFSLTHAEKWRNGEEETFDWSHLSDVCSEGDRKKWMKKEETLRRKVKSIMKFDESKENPIDKSVFSKASCVTSFYLLSHISKDREAYSKNIRKLASMLDIGGHLFLGGTFNVKYFSIGEHQFHSLPVDEEFIRTVLADGGFSIKLIEKQDSKVVNKAVKYEKVFLAYAVKVKEV